MSSATLAVVRDVARRGAPPRRALVRAVCLGAAAQLAGVALVGGATALLTWSSAQPSLAAVAGLLLAVELVAFARAPLRHAERLASHDLGLGGLGGWRTWLLDGVATWSPSRIATARAGDLLARCLGDADELQDLWVRVVVPVASILVALSIAGVLIAVASPSAGIAILVATVVVGVLTGRCARRAVALGTAESSLRGQFAARTVEYVHGAEALAVLGAAHDHAEGSLELVHAADALEARRRALTSTLCVFAAVLGAATVVLAAATSSLGGTHPSVATGVVVATIVCAELLGALPLSLEPLGAVAGAAARLDSLAEPIAAGERVAGAGPLAMRDVDVAVAPDEPVLVSHVDVEVSPGRMVSVSGPSGSGKTALLATAAKLEPARRGAVCLDGVDVTELTEASLRRRVGWMPTNPGLLEGRVRDILDVGRGITDRTLDDALGLVGLSDELAGRGGLDAMIGSRGADLSDGQRRRLALARLLAGDCDVYVLDEPTSGLDEAGSAAVIEALRGATVLVATHDAQLRAAVDEQRSLVDSTLQRLSR